MYLKEMKITDLEPTEKRVFIIPLGSTEQHGPFLPLGTDTYILDEVILRANSLDDKRNIFLPSIEYTCSEEHEGFAGSLWLTRETLFMVLNDICHSLSEIASHIVLVTCHGGNIEPIDEFLPLASEVYRHVKFLHLTLLNDEKITHKKEELLEGPVDVHAGNSEISTMLAIRPDLTIVPQHDYPKKVIPENRLKFKETTEDGIDDPNTKWITNQKIGEQIITMYVDKLRVALSKI